MMTMMTLLFAFLCLFSGIHPGTLLIVVLVVALMFLAGIAYNAIMAVKEFTPNDATLVGRGIATGVDFLRHNPRIRSTIGGAVRRRSRRAGQLFDAVTKHGEGL